MTTSSNADVLSREEKLFEREIALQKKVFGATWPRILDEAIREYVMLIHVEADELLRETNFKRHRAIKPLDMNAIKDEIADLQIFVLALAGVTFASYGEFLECVEKKVYKNDIREDWEINNGHKLP